MRKRKRERQERRKNKVAPENQPRINKTEVGAAETVEDNLKDLGKQAQVKSPSELTGLIRTAAADGTYSQLDSANTDLQLAGLIAVTQEALAQEVGFAAGKAKESRVFAEEAIKKLEAAGLLPKGSTYDQLRRGSIFLNNGRRIAVTELLGALALVKSAVLIERQPGDTALKERLFSDVPGMLIPQFQTQLTFQVGTWNIIEVDGTSSYGEIACTTKYDAKTMTHLIYYRVDTAVTALDTSAFKGSPTQGPATLVPASFFWPGGPCSQSVVCRKITEMFPNIKDGDRLPLNWTDDSINFGFDSVTGMMIPTPTAPPVIAVKIAEAAHAFDTTALVRVAGMLGVTHLINHPAAQAAGLLQGSLEGLLSMAGTMDLSTNSRG